MLADTQETQTRKQTIKLHKFIELQYSIPDILSCMCLKIIMYIMTASVILQNTFFCVSFMHGKKKEKWKRRIATHCDETDIFVNH